MAMPSPLATYRVYISQTKNKFLMIVKLKNVNFYSTLLPTGELVGKSQRRIQER